MSPPILPSRSGLTLLLPSGVDFTRIVTPEVPMAEINPVGFVAEDTRIQKVMADLTLEPESPAIRFFSPPSNAARAPSEPAVDLSGIPYAVHPVQKGVTRFQATWTVENVEPMESGTMKVTFLSVGEKRFELEISDAEMDRLGIALESRGPESPVVEYYLMPKVRPEKAVFNPFVRADDLDLGNTFDRLLSQHGEAAASAVFLGDSVDPQKVAEDRVQVGRSPEGFFRACVIDGMGGHGNGNIAAEVLRNVMGDAFREGLTVQESFARAQEAIQWEKIRIGNADAGAVMTASFENPDGSLDVATVGDTEALVISLPTQGNPAEVIYASRRSGRRQPADGDEAAGRLREDRSSVSAYMGENAAKPEPVIDRVELPPGRSYLLILATDGVTGNFVTYEEMANVITRYGAKSAAEARDLLMTESLLRSRLALLQQEQPNAWKTPLRITETHVRQAYRAATFKVYGEAYDLPADWRSPLEGYWIDVDGYVTTQPNFRAFGKSTDQIVDLYRRGIIAGRFKADDQAVTVALFER